MAKITAKLAIARLELIGKVLLALGALSFAVGIFIVTSDSSANGIPGISLNRPQYILAGLGWLGVTFITFAPPIALAFVWRQPTLRSVFSIRRIIWLAALSMLLSEKLVRSSFSVSGLWEPPALRSAIVVSAIQLIVLVLAYSLWGVALNDGAEEIEESGSGKGPDPRAIAFGFLFLMISLIPLWVPAYLSFIYPHMEPQFGGGARSTAFIVLRGQKDDQSQLLKDLGQIPSSAALTTARVIVIDLANDPIAVAPEGWYGRSILVRKDLIASIYLCPPGDDCPPPGTTFGRPWGLAPALSGGPEHRATWKTILGAIF
jgi:hypothetical protein